MTNFLAGVRAALVAAVLSSFAGCAALQIDVDVYKGPLVNNEDIQRQQVISMALSAKPLMMSARNLYLGRAFAGAPDAGVLAEVQECYGKLFDRAYLMRFKLAAPEDKYKRLAIQLNDLLTFYADKTFPTLATNRPPCEARSADLDSGFAAGRYEEGIQTLADRLLVQSTNEKTTRSPAVNRLEDRVKLENLLVDLAARMSFLSTNQWLVEKADDDTDRYKSLFEAIANTILLHIDDIQNRQKSEEAGKKIFATEKTSRNKNDPGSPAIDSLSNSAIDVIDATIAELRYAYIQALKTGGKEATAAVHLAQALEEAKRQRSQMIYLRPSSAYLRSVFAATYTQEDPGLGWQNMLNDQIFNMASRTFRGDAKERDLSQLRAGLDKAFWQNINTVRVGAAGSSNFVVAKDDVGNWYVKNMGSDPAAMVNAAKNLALYNVGGQFDTNLLRVAELRNRKDDTNLSDSERDRASAELNQLTRGRTGPAVAAHGNTWTLFEQHYTQQGDSQLRNIASQVDTFAQALQRRWAVTMKEAPSEAQRSTVTNVLTQPSVTAALAAVKTAVAVPEGGNSSDALVNTLEALQQYRNAIDAHLLGADALVAQETADAMETERLRATAEQAVEAGLKQLTVAEGTLRIAEAAAEQGNSTLLAGARTAFQQARTRLEADTLAATVARKNAAAAADALMVAEQRRKTALDDVEIVLGAYVRNEAGKRMRAIDEMETAIKVIGQSIQ